MNWPLTGQSEPHNAAMMSAALLLAVGFLCMASMIDVRQRRIPNEISLAVALLAIPFCYGAAGGPGLLSLLRHLSVPLLLAVPMSILFALRILGGGDVKLILASSLWVSPEKIATLAMIVILLGGLVAVLMQLLDMIFQAVKPESVPYGLPIAAGVLVLQVPTLRQIATILGTGW